MRVLGLGSLEYAVLSTGAFICAILLLGDHSPRAAVTLSWTIGVPAGTVLAVLAVRYRNSICRGPFRFLRAPLDAIEVVGKIVASPRRHGGKAFTGMSVYWAGEVFVLWTCLAAFTRHTPSVLAVVVGYATGYALTRRTLPLGGPEPSRRCCPSPSSGSATACPRPSSRSSPTASSTSGCRSAPRRGAVRPAAALPEPPSPPGAEVGRDDGDVRPSIDAGSSADVHD